MPKSYPKEFRKDVVKVARNREPGRTISRSLTTSVSPSRVCATGCVSRVEGGIKPGTTAAENTELREAKSGSVVGAGERGPAPCRGLSVAGQPAGKTSTRSSAS